jgi:preprotein translocase subunit SecG
MGGVTNARGRSALTFCYTVEVVILYYLVVTLHILVCLFLTVVVLLQSGKAADLAGAFGGMGSQTAFGPRGSATLLSKATTISAIAFMFTSVTLSIMGTRMAGGVGSTILERHPTKSAPAPSNQVPIQVPPRQTAPSSTPQQQPAPAPAKK